MPDDEPKLQNYLVRRAELKITIDVDRTFGLDIVERLMNAEFQLRAVEKTKGGRLLVTLLERS